MDVTMSMRQLSSQKGKTKIGCQDGYVYILDRKAGDRHYWRCELKTECNGRVITEFLNGQHVLVKKTKCHLHAPAICRGDVMDVRTSIRNLAPTSREPPARIVQQESNAMISSARQQLPTENALKQLLRRTRNAGRPREPESLDDLELGEDCKFTLQGKSFLRCNVTCDDGARVIVFTTDENIRHLASSRTWLMDGTFKTVSRLFEQLYTVHGYVQGSLFPLVFCLMSRRTQLAYQQLLREVTDIAAEQQILLCPTTVLVDFEVAAINAVRVELPDASIHGCFFHLCQILWRRVQNLGLTKLYADNVDDFAIKVRQLAALAFLPVEDVRETYSSLRTQFTADASALLEWWETNYILGRPVRRSTADGQTVVIRTTPSFPPSLWNVSDLVDAGQPRTINGVEAWHRRWNALVGTQHVSVFTMIQSMVQEQERTETCIERLIRGDAPRLPRKEQRLREDRLRRILDDRENRDVQQFLRGVAHNFSL